jgi:hypothetical protein
VARWNSFILEMVLGVREGNLYRMRDQTMGSIDKKCREIEEEEQVTPPVVR